MRLSLMLLTVTTILASHASRAEEIDIQAVRDRHEAMTSQIQGLTMTALGLCDPSTGRKALTREGSEVCVQIMVESEERLKAVQAVFAMPLRIEGVLFGFDVMKKIKFREE